MNSTKKNGILPYLIDKNENDYCSISIEKMNVISTDTEPINKGTNEMKTEEPYRNTFLLAGIETPKRIHTQINYNEPPPTINSFKFCDNLETGANTFPLQPQEYLSVISNLKKEIHWRDNLIIELNGENTRLMLENFQLKGQTNIIPGHYSQTDNENQNKEEEREETDDRAILTKNAILRLIREKDNITQKEIIKTQ